AGGQHTRHARIDRGPAEHVDAHSRLGGVFRSCGDRSPRAARRQTHRTLRLRTRLSPQDRREGRQYNRESELHRDFILACTGRYNFSHPCPIRRTLPKRPYLPRVRTKTSPCSTARSAPRVSRNVSANSSANVAVTI